MVHLLLRRGADIQLSDSCGDNIYTIAYGFSIKGNPDMLAYLNAYFDKHQDKKGEWEELKKTKIRSEKIKMNQHTHYFVFTGKNDKNENFLIVNKEISPCRQRLISFPVIDSLDEVVQFLNSRYTIGVGRSDFNFKTLGTLGFESVEHETRYAATITLCEIQPSKIDIFIKMTCDISNDFMILDANTIRKNVNEKNDKVQIGDQFFSKLSLSILNIILNKYLESNDIELFSITEKRYLERIYQKAYERQYALILCATKGDTVGIDRLIEAGALIQFSTPAPKAYEDEYYCSHITPVEAAIVEKKYECVLHILGYIKLIFTVQPVKQLIKENQVEIYKKLHEKGCGQTLMNLKTQYDLAKEHSPALASYILSYASNDEIPRQAVASLPLALPAANNLNEGQPILFDFDLKREAGDSNSNDSIKVLAPTNTNNNKK